MNRLREIEASIQREHLNLQKSAKRPRALQGILEKSERLRDLIIEYKNILNTFDRRIPSTEWNNEVETYQALKIRYGNCIKILESTPIRKHSLRTVAKTIILCGRLNNSQIPQETHHTASKYSLKSVANLIICCKRLSGNFRQWENTPAVSITSNPTALLNQNPKMPNETFDIKTATALVQPYDGSAEGLDAFLDATSLLEEITSTDMIPRAIKFLKTRLTGKARLGLPETLKTINELAQNVKDRCASRITPDNVIAKLKAAKQKGSVENFCDEVDALTNKLKAVYIEQGIPIQLATSMATKTGVETLINGTNSQDNKIILKAGTFNDIKDATQKMLENSNNNSPHTQVLSFNTRGANTHINQGQHSRNNRGNYRNQSSSNRDSNYYPRNYSNGRFRGGQPQQFRAQPPQRRYNGSYSNRSQRGRSNFATRNVYTASAQQAQVMQAPMQFSTPMALVGNQHQGMLTMPHGGPIVQPGGSMQNNAFLGHPGQYITPQNCDIVCPNGQ